MLAAHAAEPVQGDCLCNKEIQRFVWSDDMVLEYQRQTYSFKKEVTGANMQKMCTPHKVTGRSAAQYSVTV